MPPRASRKPHTRAPLGLQTFLNAFGFFGSVFACVSEPRELRVHKSTSSTSSATVRRTGHRIPPRSPPRARPVPGRRPSPEHARYKAPRVHCETLLTHCSTPLLGCSHRTVLHTPPRRRTRPGDRVRSTQPGVTGDGPGPRPPTPAPEDL